jgi:CHASE1-domain containing sensor protein
VLVVASVVILVGLSLVVALVSFYALKVSSQVTNNLDPRTRDSEYSRVSGDSTRSSDSIQTALVGALSVHYIVGSFFSMAKMNVDYYHDLLPFYSTAQLKQPSYNGVLIGCTVPNVSRTEFEAKVRTFGTAFQNFYINARDSLNNPYPANQPVYYPYYMAVPESILAANLGFDVASHPIRKATLLKAAAVGDITASSVVRLSGQNVTGIATYRWFPNSTIYTNVAFKLDALLSNGLTNGTLEDYIVQFYDAETGEFWHSTMTEAQNPYNLPLKNVTVAQHKAIIANKANTDWDALPVSRDIKVADRTIHAIFIPLNSYARTHRKWLALSMSLFMGFVCIIFAIIFIKQLHGISLKGKSDKKRIAVLNDSRKKITHVLERIDRQDSQTKMILDTLNDMIFVTNKEGGIVTTNVAFNRELSYNQGDTMSLTISKVIPNIPDDFWNVVDWKGFALTSFKNLVPIEVDVAFFDTADDVEQPDTTWAYVIVMRNLTDREKLLANARGQKSKLKSNLKIAEFNARFGRDAFRQDLLQFAERVHTSEAVRFLIDVIEYKKSKVDKRAEMQFLIFDTYLRIGAPQQLNISTELSERMMVNVQQSLGDAELFKGVEELIRGMVVLEIYPRFLQNNINM